MASAGPVLLSPNDALAGKDLYTILGVSPKASRSEITAAYHNLCLKHHPDKQKSTDGIDKDGIFTTIKEAYDILINDSSRAEYDHQRGYIAEKDQVKLTKQSRSTSESILTTMEDSILDLRAKAKNGLLILEARYGDLGMTPAKYVQQWEKYKEYPLLAVASSLSTVMVGDDHPVVGRYIDVTVQLQFLVENNSLELRGSKANLMGFYDPTETASTPSQKSQSQLFVRYRIGDILHEVTVGDEEPLRIPDPSHEVKEASPVCSPFFQLVERLREQRIVRATKRKRRIIFAAGVGAAATAYVFWHQISPPIASALYRCRSLLQNK